MIDSDSLDKFLTMELLAKSSLCGTILFEELLNLMHSTSIHTMQSRSGYQDTNQSACSATEAHDDKDEVMIVSR